MRNNSLPISQKKRFCPLSVKDAPNVDYKNIKLNETLIRNNLYSENIPDPDILIRTGGRKRLSNFLLLQLKYSNNIYASYSTYC